jgi:hypothetical protein
MKSDDLEQRVTALEAQGADHEARLAALEGAETEQPPPDIEQPPVDEGETLQQLVDRGGAVLLPAPNYTEFCTVSKPVQVTGMPTTIDVTGVAIGNGKAIFEANADLELQDLVLRGASVNDNNGCAVRGGVGVLVSLTDCEITGCEMGLLLAGDESATIDIYACNIHDNGLPSGGLGHEIYINWPGETFVTISHSTITGGPRSCIAIKSRASSTRVTSCAIRGSTSSDGSIAGRVIDLPDGGVAVFEECEIELRATSPTGSILGVCTESTSLGAGTVILRRCKVIDGRGRGGEFWARSGAGCKLVLENCTYTAAAPPTLTGWADVQGEFTKA